MPASRSRRRPVGRTGRLPARRSRAAASRHPARPPFLPIAHADRRARRHPRRVRHRSATSCARHPDVPLWLQVGDVASNDGEYFSPPAPLYWIKGNNEDFDVIAAAIGGHVRRRRRCTTCATAARIRSGRGASPRSAARSRRAGTTRRPPRCRRRKGRKPDGHVAEARQEPRRQAPAFREGRSAGVQGADGIDVFLTHEAPRPFYPAGRRIDAGKTVLNDVLDGDAAAAASVRPSSRVHRLVSARDPLDRPRHRDQSYLLIHAETFRCERLDT